MRFSVLALCSLVLLLQGCSLLTIYPSENASVGQKGEVPPPPKTTKKEAQSGYRLDRELRTTTGSSTEPAPDVVIKVNPESAALPGEMDVRLQAVAEQMRNDDRLNIRLEGYAPDGGSPVWNMGTAEKSVKLVKERLEAMRVAPKRIQIASYGEEHEFERDKRWHWVEIYFI